MEIQLFKSSQFGEIRTAGTPDEPQFCLNDLCKALDLAPRAVKQRLSDDVCSTYAIPDSMGREQQTNFVNEDGLYDVILDSRKPEARAFRKWITSEVIPSIRKTGGYIPASVEDTEEEIMAKALQISKRTIEQQKQKLQMLEGKNALLEQENQELAPKAEYTDQVLQSGGTYTNTEMAKELNFRSWNAFIDACKKDGIVFKHPGGMYMLYAKYAGKGYMKTRTNTFSRRDGSVGTSVISVWTEEGRKFLHEHFNIALQPVDLTMSNFLGR